MAVNGVNSSQNGAYTGQERRASVLGHIGDVATESSAANRKARTQHIYDLRERVAFNERTAADGRAAIGAAEELHAAIPLHLRGWPLEIVMVLALLSIVLEAVPASLFTQVFVTASTFQLYLLTAAFTIVGALLALFFGELLRNTREPAVRHLRENILLIVIGLLVVGFLVIGYELRIAFTTNANATVTVAAISAPLEALALTAIAAIGIALTVVSSYYREGLESFRVRSSLRSLRSKLTTNDAHLQANKRDLDRATEAAYNGPERRRPLQPQPDGPGPTNPQATPS